MAHVAHQAPPISCAGHRDPCWMLKCHGTTQQSHYVPQRTGHTSPQPAPSFAKGNAQRTKAALRPPLGQTAMRGRHRNAWTSAGNCSHAIATTQTCINVPLSKSHQVLETNQVIVYALKKGRLRLMESPTNNRQGIVFHTHTHTHTIFFTISPPFTPATTTRQGWAYAISHRPCSVHSRYHVLC